MKSKVFGIGFHKTGSTTLETALIELGFDAVGKRDHLFAAIDNDEWEIIDQEVNSHDAFRDMPWPLFYQALDQRYPDSKFILTVRDSRTWLNSCLNHYKKAGDPVFSNIYGEGNHFPVGNEDVWLEKYILHNKAVRNYFLGRSKDFLEVDWEKGSGWKELCNFLHQPVPNRAFPHANQGKYTILEKVKRRIHYIVDKDGFIQKNRDL